MSDRHLFVVIHENSVADTVVARTAEEAHEMTTCVEARDDFSCQIMRLDVELAAHEQQTSRKVGES